MQVDDNKSLDFLCYKPVSDLLEMLGASNGKLNEKMFVFSVATLPHQKSRSKKEVFSPFLLHNMFSG